MPALEENKLREHLASGDLSSLYVVYGEEKYLVKRVAGRIMKRAAGEAFPEFNRNEFTNSATVDEISDAVEALPFFAEHKCVSVADFDLDEKGGAEGEKVFQLLENLPETTTLVFWYPTLEWEGKSSAKWKKFLKAAEKSGFTLCCRRRDAADLKRLLRKEAEKNGCILSQENAGRMIEYAGNDLKALLNEIVKLCAYAGTGEITREMIEELVSKTTETTVFLMANALIAGNYEKAYLLLDTLFYQNEEPVAILAALSSLYVDMYRVKAALGSGLTSGAPGSYGEYKGKEFRLRNAEKNGRGLPPKVLRESLFLLLETDLKLKGSRLDARIVLEELVAKLLVMAKNGKGSP